MKYKVHFVGWNNRYDEWVNTDRIKSLLERGKGGFPEIRIIRRKEKATQCSNLGRGDQSLRKQNRGESGNESPNSARSRSPHRPSSDDDSYSESTYHSSEEQSVSERSSATLLAEEHAARGPLSRMYHMFGRGASYVVSWFK